MNVPSLDKPANILVVDDTPDNLRLLGGFLRERGYSVRLARDGNLAIKSALEEPPDLILLDIMMPNPDGYEVCCQLKAKQKTCQIPIIFISAKGEIFDKIKAFSVGGVDYITKPFELEEVAARVENQLKIWSLSQALVRQNMLLQEEVGERERIEIALKKSEEKYRALVESSQDLIWSVDREGRYTFINWAAQKIYGYFPEEMIGRKFSEFLLPQQYTKDLEVFDKILMGVTISQYESIHLKKDNTPIYLLFNAQPLRDADGNIIGATGTATNITERKHAQDALTLSEQRLQLALEGSELGLWDWNLETGKTYFSPQWQKILGYQDQQIENHYQGWTKLVHPEDLPESLAALKACLEGHTSIYKTEFRMRAKSGEWRWIMAHGKIFERSANGKPLRMAGTHKDISDRKHIEIALQQQLKRERLVNCIQERIRSSLNLQEILRTAVEEVRHFLSVDRVLIYQILSTESQNPITESVEPNLPTIFDQNFQKEWLLCEFHQQHERHKIVCMEDIAQEEISPDLADFLHQLQVKAKLVVPILKDTNLWGFLIVHHCRGPRPWQPSEIESIRQISVQLAIAVQQSTLFEQAKAEIIERKKAEKALQKAVKVADTANRAKSEFLANMSHELRTPLNAILGFAQLMNMDSSLSPEHQRHVGIINRAGVHLLELINDILEMSKIEAGRTTLNEVNFDLMLLLQSLKEILQVKATEKGLKLLFEISPNLPQWIRTDQGKLRQVLLNIIGNAIKFTTQGWVILRVSQDKFSEIKTQNLEESLNSKCRIFFSIEDSGTGIYPEEIDQLFQVFRQTETGRKSHEGTGLGLAISQKFVQLMGGDITVTSVVDQGTTFTFNILVQEIEQEKLQTFTPQRQIMAIAPAQPKYKILIVDDLPESRLLLSETLTQVGFKVKEAENGLQTIQIWRTWKPHLIIMDMEMPVMDGLQASQQIKSHHKGKEAVIIAVTASAFEEDRSRVLLAGCDDFISKPFKREELLEKIRQHLEVQYTYQETPNFTKDSPKNPENLSPEFLNAHLAQMSPQWIQQVYEFAAQGADGTILKLLKQVPSENAPLAEALANLANNFEFEKIMKLLQRVDQGTLNRE